jgi:outer membrane protein assembly factor BamB
MSDMRSILEGRREDLRPDPGGFDRLVRLRARRQRNRQIGSAFLALVVAAAGTSGAVIALRSRPAPRPGTPISPTNVSRLQLGWTASIEGPVSRFAPVVRNGIVYVSSDRLYAFPESCEPTSRCRPLWVGLTGSRRPLSSPALWHGVVYVSGGALFAFPAGCATDGSACEPIGRVDPFPDDANGFSAPVVSGGLVYVNSRTGPYAFSASCVARGETCEATWHGVGSGGFSPPVVYDGVVLSNEVEGLRAYPVSCKEGASGCEPLWTSPHGGPLSSPVVANGRVFVHHGAGELYAFPISCGRSGSTCQPDWIWKPPFGYTAPTVAGGGGIVYVGADRLYAFSPSCGSGGAACKPLWTAQVPGTKAPFLPAPAVGRGLVFMSSDRLRAFPASCRPGGTCRPLWVSRTLGAGQELFTAALTERSVYVTSAKGDLYAFTVPTR